jgi:glutamyl-tRNA synthetase
MFLDLGDMNWIIANTNQQFNLKITRGNTVVAFEKLWFLQKAHAQRFAATEGPQFDEMVNKVCTVIEDGYSMDKL